MVILHRNKTTRRLFLRTSIHGTGRHFTEQLNTAGELRLFKAGLDIGHRLPGWLLEKLEEHGEVHPSLGVFRGQRSLNLDDKVTPVPRSRRRHTAPQPSPLPGMTQQQLFIFLQVLPTPDQPAFVDVCNSVRAAARTSLE